MNDEIRPHNAEFWPGDTVYAVDYLDGIDPELGTIALRESQGYMGTVAKLYPDNGDDLSVIWEYPNFEDMEQIVRPDGRLYPLTYKFRDLVVA